MKRKQGISLIVLIITIVVIIILAAAIIMNLRDTNVISNAKEAVVKQDFRTLQDELDMHIAEQYIARGGNFNPEDLNADTKDEVEYILKSIKKTNYADYVLIENGSIVISDSMPDPQKTWAMEVLGLISASNNKPTDGDQTPVEPDTPDVSQTDTPVITVGTKVENANSSITGENFAYNNPVIPVGFKAINTTDASWTDGDKDGCPDGWNDGLVIRDEDSNEFVWVPCTINGANGTVTYTKWDSAGITYTATTDDIKALPMKDSTTRVTEIEQIKKYGGFYIGRYEAGVPANQNTINGLTEDTSNVDGTPVVKREATVWTNISYNKAMPNAKKLYENSSSVKSGIVTGTQWDTVCAWIQSEKDSNENVIHDVTDSSSWGNYYDSTSPANITGFGERQTAGYSEYWKAKNIYDLAGNLQELISETYYSTHQILRAGSYLDLGSSKNYPVMRRYYCKPDEPQDELSFRISLYII